MISRPCLRASKTVCCSQRHDCSDSAAQFAAHALSIFVFALLTLLSLKSEEIPTKNPTSQPAPPNDALLPKRNYHYNDFFPKIKLLFRFVGIFIII